MLASEKLKELMENEEFISGMIQAQNPNELGIVLAENHVELSSSSLEEAFNEVQKQISEAENGELSEEALEAVSGGWGSLLTGVIVSGQLAAWASVTLPVVGAFVAFGLAKYGINKLKKRFKKQGK